MYPEGRVWVDASRIISDHVRKEVTQKQLLRNKRQLDVLDKTDVDDVLLIVTRVSAFYETPAEAEDIFKRLRLYRPWTAVFTRRTKLMLRWLFLIRRYIIVIMPTEEQVKEMIHSRGYAKSNKDRIPLSNLVIEKQLGEIDVLCVEDMAKVLMEGGEHFNRVNLSLWPFQLDQSFADRSKAVTGLRRPKHLGIKERPEDFPRRMLAAMDEASGNAGRWLGPLLALSWSRKEKSFQTRKKHRDEQRRRQANNKAKKLAERQRAKERAEAKKAAPQPVKAKAAAVKAKDTAKKEAPPTAAAKAGAKGPAAAKGKAAAPSVPAKKGSARKGGAK